MKIEKFEDIQAWQKAKSVKQSLVDSQNFPIPTVGGGTTSYRFCKIPTRNATMTANYQIETQLAGVTRGGTQ